MVLSVKPRSDTINIWNSSCENKEHVVTVQKKLQELLKLDDPVEYQVHQVGLFYNVYSFYVKICRTMFIYMSCMT